MNQLLQRSTKPPRHPEVVGGVILVHPDQRHCLLVHQRQSNLWSIPKGHAKEGESTLNCAIRELYEETNIPLNEHATPEMCLQSIYGDAFCYTLPPDHIHDLITNDENEIDGVMWVSFTSIKQNALPTNIFTKTVIGKLFNFKNKMWNFGAVNFNDNLARISATSWRRNE